MSVNNVHLCLLWMGQQTLEPRQYLQGGHIVMISVYPKSYVVIL